MTPTRKKVRRQRRARSFIVEIAIVIVAAFVLSFILKTFFVESFYIPSASMEPTLIGQTTGGDRVMVNKLVPKVFSIHRGDIVVFKDEDGWLSPVTDTRHGFTGAIDKGLTFIGVMPEQSQQYIIKRVIGLPGDHVSCAGAGSPVVVNGVPLSENYIMAGAVPSVIAFDKIVPKGSLFVMGDNRPDSEDSRYTVNKPGGGFVAEDNVVGVAFLRSWPISRIGLLRNPGHTFADVPKPSASNTSSSAPSVTNSQP